MSLSHFVSLILFLAFGIYAFWGMYTLSLNAKRMLNRVFFVACLAMCIWTFCFSIANSAPDYDTVLLWRRMASLGWGLLYALLLHYFLIITRKRRLLEKRWIYLLVYLPGILTVFVFGAHPDLAAGQYNLIRTAVGWINVPVNNWWDWYFNTYYISYAVIGLLLLWQWGRNSHYSDDKKQAYMLIASFTLAFILGTVTDIVINSYFSFRVPQLAPVFGLIPSMAIFYFIKRYGLMRSLESPGDEADRILSEANLAKLFQILSLVFVYGGCLHFAAQYFFNRESLASALSFSTLFIVIAMVLQIIQRAPISVNLKETAFILILSISTLSVILRFVELASVTVWAIAFIVLIVCILFAKQRMMVLSGIVILFTQIWVWITVPVTSVTVDGSDHLARIGILLLAFLLAYYVNRLFIQRLDEIRARIRFQKTISQISADFVSVSESSLNVKTVNMLGLCGEGIRAEHAYFVSLIPEPKIIERCKEGVEPAYNLVSDLHGGGFLWWMDQVQKSEVIHIPDVKKLPPEAYLEKSLFRQYDIKSLLSIPVEYQGRLLGLLLFGTANSANIWHENHLELVQIVANILADAMIKVEAEKEINYLAYYDGVTGLPNRTLFKDRLRQSLPLARRTGKLVGVVFLDLDSFKAVNDSIGHEGGDVILKKVSDRLSSSLRQYDTVARFGGDEFLIALNQIDRIDDIKKIANHIMQTFALPFDVDDQEFFISASAGIAVFPFDGEEADILIKNADLAMYVSKNKGKNQYTLCSYTMKDDMLKKMTLTNGLYRALERNELVLYYQPMVNISTRKIMGLEALIRWNHPDFGMIPPSAFIDLAEQTGLIRPIGQWVLQTACRQNKEWQVLGLPPIRIAVNLSVEQFRDPELISIVARTLGDTGLEPKYLELEITESASHDRDNIMRVLHELKKLGVSIAIDDFGIEYSSLSRLKVLPVDRIKIDMQFVQGITESDKDEAIAKTIVQLAKNLKLNVTAEGVETQSQFEFFKKQMCDEVQGFFFFKPMPVEEVEDILRLIPMAR